jgi:hypothetical protein
VTFTRAPFVTLAQEPLLLSTQYVVLVLVLKAIPSFAVSN